LANLASAEGVVMLGPICWSLAVPLVLGAVQDEGTKWKPFVSKEGGFEITMPGSPTETKKTVKTATGQLHVTVHSAEGKNEALFVVSYTDFTDADLKEGSVKKRLNNARDGAIGNTGGKLRSEEDIENSGIPGREIIIEKDGAVIVKMRLFLVKRRLYQVMVLGSGPDYSSKEVKMFLDSFHLNK
jgi:hypothetical protein